MHLGNSNKYTKVHVQYPYIAMSLDPHVPLTELQLNLCTCMAVAHFLSDGSSDQISSL